MKDAVHRLFRTAALMFIAAVYVVMSPLTVYALDQDEIEALEGYFPFWSAFTDNCAVTGDAVELLKKQTNLDARWIPLITYEAKVAGADPLAMASLLFWEHRGFPKYDAAPEPPASEDVERSRDARGRGPWQITRGSWPATLGNYRTAAYDPVISTRAAAPMVFNYGGVAGSPAGSIEQDFGKNVKINSMATVAKNYNAGQATWRQVAGRSDGIATHGQAGRTWMEGNKGPWFSDKQKIIDDYIVAMTYAYYQIGTGKPLGRPNTDQFVQEGLQHQEEIKNFKIGAAGSAAGTDFQCSIASGGGIVKTALGLAWPSPNHGRNKEDATPAYQVAMPQYNGSQGDFPYSDCGVFVATVIRMSNADPNYPPRGTAVQLPYIRRHPEKYQVYDNLTNTSQLVPGDIFIFNGGGKGHTFVYTGPYKGSNGKQYNSASASWRDHVPESTNAYFDQSGYHFTVARVKGVAGAGAGGQKAL